jgi:hypothetical protein
LDESALCGIVLTQTSNLFGDLLTELSSGSFDGKSLKLVSTQFQRAVVSADSNSAAEEEEVATKYACE